jgi:tetratricopeptide (TPR) repeat protein
VLLILFAYVASGAAYKVVYGLRHEREFVNQAYLWYKRQFRAYGPLPVARLFGPAFALYVQGGAGRGASFSWVGSALATKEELANMERLLQRYPHSIWADNAAFEIARATLRQPASEVWAITTHQAGEKSPAFALVEDNLEGAEKAFQDFASRYQTSPFSPFALAQVAELSLSLLDFQTAQAAYERLLKDYPFAPEAREAGLALSAVYLRAGRWQEGLRAADLAAAAAPWELRAEALLAAAQAAARAGDGAGARARFQRAHAAAKEARRFASEHRRHESKMSGGEIVLRSDGVMRACEQALAGELKSFAPASPPPGVEVTGRILRRGEPVAGVRAALAGAVDPKGKLTPFLESPAAEAATGADGSFRLQGVQPGIYRAAAYGYRQPRSRPAWQVTRPPLPVRVDRLPVALPTCSLVPRPAPPGRAARAPGGGTRSQAGRGERGGSEAGGRGRGGGRRGGRGGRTGGRGSGGRSQRERGSRLGGHRGGERPGR